MPSLETHCAYCADGCGRVVLFDGDQDSHRPSVTPVRIRSAGRSLDDKGARKNGAATCTPNPHRDGLHVQREAARPTPSSGFLYRRANGPWRRGGQLPGRTRAMTRKAVPANQQPTLLACPHTVRAHWQYTDWRRRSHVESTGGQTGRPSRGRLPRERGTGRRGLRRSSAPNRDPIAGWLCCSIA